MNIAFLLDILSFVGVPTIFLGLLGIVWRKLVDDINDTKAVKLGVQALLRDRLYYQYNKAMDRGYAHIYERENFLNCYNQYHQLGTNGVMDDLVKKFMALPTEPKEVKNEQEDSR